VLGLIAIIAIQRAVQKILISVFLSREFKNDETNQAWWSGKWGGRGLGAHAMSQPFREWIVKTIELQLWTGDMILGHFLQLILTPVLLIPFADRLHATSKCHLLCSRIWADSYRPHSAVLVPAMPNVFLESAHSLFAVWLRPSKQIRAPLYSFKQKRQRRNIVRSFPRRRLDPDIHACV
jgi:1,3-beta-glucan synthase